MLMVSFLVIVAKIGVGGGVLKVNIFENKVVQMAKSF